MKVTIIANEIHFNDTRSINFKDIKGNIYCWNTKSKKFDNPNKYRIGKVIDISFKVIENGNYTTIKNVKENKQVNFEDLQVGDIVNYNIQLISGNVKNETSLVIEKTSEYVKLNNWLVTKDYFNTLKNVTIIEDVKKSLKSN